MQAKFVNALCGFEDIKKMMSSMVYINWLLHGDQTIARCVSVSINHFLLSPFYLEGERGERDYAHTDTLLINYFPCIKKPLLFGEIQTPITFRLRQQSGLLI